MKRAGAAKGEPREVARIVAARQRHQADGAGHAVVGDAQDGGGRRPGIEAETGARYVTLDELLAISDFVSLHAPRNEASHHIIDAAALRRMKSTAVLVNTARGALIDEPALVVALRTGRIAAAGLDVFEHEPALSPGLTDLDNVLLAPHLGSASTEARSMLSALR